MLIKSLIPISLAATLFATAMPAMSHVDDATWANYQANPEHTGFVPININAKRIVQKWQVPIGLNPMPGVNYSIYPATIGKKYVFIASNNNSYSNTLQAFSIKDGKQIWIQDFKNKSVQPTAYDNGKVIVQTVNNYDVDTALRAYEEEQGQLIYKIPFRTQWQHYNAPVVVKGIIYACTGYMSGLTAYEINTGNEIWSIPQFDTLSDDATAAANEEYLLYYNAGKLNIIDKATGIITDRIQDDNWQWSGYSDPTPVFSDKHTALISFSNNLTQYDLKNKKVVFTLKNVKGNASVDKETIYVIQDDFLTAINKKNGQLKWQIKTKKYSRAYDIIVTKDKLFVSDDNETIAYAKDKSHQALWRSRVVGKMSLSNKGLFIVSPTGTLTAFSFH